MPAGDQTRRETISQRGENRAAPGRASLLAAMGRSVMMLCDAPSCESPAWLDAAARAVWHWACASISASRRSNEASGAWVALFDIHSHAQEWAHIGHALSGYTDQRLITRVNDGLSLHDHDDLPEGLCLRSRAATDASCDSASLQAAGLGESYLAMHARHGLGVFARCTRIVSGLDAMRVVVVQIDGRAGSLRASDALAAAEAITPFVQAAYERCIGRALARQAGMLGTLTALQRQIVPMLVKGMSQKRISDVLRRNHHTIHDQVKNIYRSLGIKSRLGLVNRWHGLAISESDTDDEKLSNEGADA